MRPAGSPKRCSSDVFSGLLGRSLVAGLLCLAELPHTEGDADDHQGAVGPEDGGLPFAKPLLPDAHDAAAVGDSEPRQQRIANQAAGGVETEKGCAWNFQRSRCE